MKYLIIDIRDNGGGLVTEVLKLADYLLPEGKTIMNTLDKDGKTEVSKSEEKPQIENINIVLLVNENSASASEILAGAMQDNKMATIVGEKTFGKGVMQELIAFGKGALKITVEEFRTPDGNVINEEGIKPDVEVEDDKETKEVDEQLDKAIEIIQGM